VKTILVLEDHASVLKLVGLVLKQYCVIEAANAEEALRLFTERGRQVHLLIADVKLPRSSGILVALLLRSEIPDLPVILTTGYPESGWSDRDAADRKRLGSNSVMLLQKPFQAHALLERVRELIGPPHAEAVRTA